MLIAGLAVAALAAPAAAAAPPPSPDLGAMALHPSDFPYGGKVTVAVDTGVLGYDEELRVGDHASGHHRAATADQILAAFGTPGEARADLASTRRSFRSRRGRKELITIVAATMGVSPKRLRLGPVRSIDAGDAAIEIRLDIPSRHLVAVTDVMTVGRVTTMVELDSHTRSQLQTHRLAILRKAAARIRAGLAPKSTASPVISGTPGVGQTLTVSTGSWDPATPPSGFAYQWQRCDAAGNACAPVPGATGSSEVVAAGDAGTTLRVQVTASNPEGSAAAESGQTAVVA
jgi:hypothetical protein